MKMNWGETARQLAEKEGNVIFKEGTRPVRWLQKGVKKAEICAQQGFGACKKCETQNGALNRTIDAMWERSLKRNER